MERYTHIKKYLLPPLEEYLAMLERAVLAKDKSYGKIIEKRKKEIQEQVKKDLS